MKFEDKISPNCSLNNDQQLRKMVYIVSYFPQRRLERGAGRAVAGVWEPSAQEWDLWNPDSPHLNVFLPNLVTVLLDIIMFSAYILLFYLINITLKIISNGKKIF